MSIPVVRLARKGYWALLASVVLGLAIPASAWDWYELNAFGSQVLEDRTLIGSGLTSFSFDGGDVKLVRDGLGNASAFWSSDAGLAESTYVLGIGWSVGQVIDPGQYVDVDADMNHHGMSIVAGCEGPVGITGVVRASVAGGSFVNLGDCGDPGTNILNFVNVAISDDGDAIVVWQDGTEIKYNLFRSGSFGTTLVLDSAVITQLDVAADEFGNFTVVFPDLDIIGWHLANDGSVTGPDIIGVGSANETSPQVSMYGNNNAIVVWGHSYVDATLGSVRGVGVNHFDGLSWGTQQRIDGGTADGTLATFPHVATQADGIAMATWTQGSAVNQELIYASRFEGGAWSSAEQISCGTAGTEGMNIDLDGHGNAAAALRFGLNEILRASGDGLGWLDTFATDGVFGCTAQGTAVYDTKLFGHQQDIIEKQVVITPHEILSIQSTSTGFFSDTVYGIVGKKDVYINLYDTETVSSIVDLQVRRPINDVCGFFDLAGLAYDEMRFSNDGASWSPFQPISTEETIVTGWDLVDPATGGISSNGQKRVFIQFNHSGSADCESLVTHDEIDCLDCGGPPPPDEDGDGVPDSEDLCPGTPPGTPVDPDGCPIPEPDEDGDGVPDSRDLCPGTPPGTPVDPDGCPFEDGAACDIDGDGVTNLADLGVVVGCYVGAGVSCDAADVNGDGVVNILDISLCVSEF